MGKEQQLGISILGRVDASLMAAVNQAKDQLKAIGADARTSNEVMKRLYANIFDGVGDGAKKEFGTAKAEASSFNEFMGRVKETFTGVFTADLVVKFFEAAVQGAEKLKQTLIDAGVQAASMEQ